MGFLSLNFINIVDVVVSAASVYLWAGSMVSQRVCVCRKFLHFLLILASFALSAVEDSYKLAFPSMDKQSKAKENQFLANNICERQNNFCLLN